MTLKALIFDVDGTMAETENVHRRAFNRAFVADGLKWHWGLDLYKDLLGVTGGKERIRHYAAVADPAFLAADDAEAHIGALHARKTELYVDMLETGEVGFRPGIERLIGEARAQGLMLAIATTTTPVNVTALLEGVLGPEGPGLFDVIAAGDAVANKKPAPDVYTCALDRLRVAPGACIAFEDSDAGLASAIGAGVPAVVTRSAFTRSGDAAGAVAVLSHLGEPDQPSEAFQGSLNGRTMVDVALLTEWLALRPGKPARVCG